MSIQTIEPRGMEAQEWCDQNTLYLTVFGAIPRYAGDWRAWAADILSLPTIHGINLPNPYLESDWRRWAAAFNLEMQGVDL